MILTPSDAGRVHLIHICTCSWMGTSSYCFYSQEPLPWLS